jgi:cellulose biosynthesis protein BcsQ
MRSITVFNNKGGVGKTTLLCNLASYMSIELHNKVLIVDADPQCNATIGRKANGLKVVEGGKIRGKKKMTAATRLNPVFRPIATQTPY